MARAPEMTALAGRLRMWLARVDWMMLFPATAALAWGLGRDSMAVVLVAVLPIFLALDSRRRGRRAALGVLDLADLSAGRPVRRGTLIAIVDDVLDECGRLGKTTAMLMIQLDEINVAGAEWGDDLGDAVMNRVTARVSSAMRGSDAVIRCGEDTMAVVLSPTRRADLDVVMNIVDRIQSAAAEPLALDGRSVRVGACIGICTATMAPHSGGAALVSAAECALRLARRSGEGAVRTFNADIRTQVETDRQLAHQIPAALESGAIRPWFQPQVDATTGALVGFEALARWHHPDLGVLSPDKFLPALGAAGRMGDLGEVMLRASLATLRDWDREGLDVPCIGVNISLEELCDPRLAERIAWHVDGFDLTPDRVAVEILETVTLREHDEVVVRNVRALRAAGFRLDLDDFGTGAASIAHIARFGVHRIKIDRSFVSGLNDCEERRRVVAAILGLARQLDIDTLAEGVESLEEQALLAEMGCAHLQGYGIARPMPLPEATAWIRHRGAARITDLRDMRARGTA